MPDHRLQKTREAYCRESCGHRSQIAQQFVIRVRPDGIAEREPRELRYRVRGDDARICSSCHQIVDAQDDAEAQR